MKSSSWTDLSGICCRRGLGLHVPIVAPKQRADLLSTHHERLPAFGVLTSLDNADSVSLRCVAGYPWLRKPMLEGYLPKAVYPPRESCGEAENGQIAVEKDKTLNPNVVILGWLMPVMSGLQDARQITRVAPKTALLMLTLHSSKQLLEEAKAVGIARFLKSREPR